jgi:hypothetical protein
LEGTADNSSVAEEVQPAEPESDTPQSTDSSDSTGDMVSGTGDSADAPGSVPGAREILAFVAVPGSSPRFLNPETAHPRIDAPGEILIRPGPRINADPGVLIEIRGGSLRSYALRSRGTDAFGLPIYAARLDQPLEPDPSVEALVSGAGLEEAVLYLVLTGDSESPPLLASEILRLFEYESGTDLSPRAPERRLSNLDRPGWNPVIGASRYEYQISGPLDDGNTGGDSTLSGSLSSPHIPGEILDSRLPSAGTYRFRVRVLGPDGLPLTGFDQWSEWVDFPYSRSSMLLDPPGIAQSLLPGIAEEQLSRAGFEVPQDEQFPAGEPLIFDAYALPAFMSFELTNGQAADLLNQGIASGDLIPGESEFGDPVLRSPANGKVVIGFDNLYYGIQFGLSLTTDVDDQPVDESIEEPAPLVEVQPGYSDHPAIGITWYGAMYLANRLSSDQGLEEVYDLAEMIWIENRRGYRLPTEMEWEAYARSRELRTPPNYYRSFDPWEDVNYPHTRSGGPTAPVNAYPNSFPQGDSSPRHLLGNVWEWCWDWYDPGAYRRYADLDSGDFRDYRTELSDADRQILVSGAELDPNDPRYLRTVRGAAWNSARELVRISNRGRFYVDETSWSVGVRFVLDL